MKFNKIALGAVALMLALGSLSFLPESHVSAATFVKKDNSTDYTVPRFPIITDSKMVWMGDDENKYYQVFAQDFYSGELKQLTETQTYKAKLSAANNYAIYLDSQKIIMMVNLQTGESTQADVKPGYYEDLQTDGEYIVYKDTSTSTLNVYNMTTMETNIIGKGQDATLANSQVAYYGSSENRLKLYDIASNTSRVLWDKKDGSLYNSHPVAFNGKYVVWIQQPYNQLKFQLRMIDVTQPDSLPSVLSFFDKAAIPVDTFVSKEIVAWTIEKDGHEVVMAANLQNKQADVAADQGEKLLGVTGSTIILKNVDNNLILRTLQSTGEGNAIQDTLVSAIPYADNIPEQVTGFFGGNSPSSVHELATSDRAVILSSPFENPFSYKGSDYTSIRYREDSKLELTKALQPEQKMVSLPWSVDVQEAFDYHVLKMVYMPSRVPSGQLSKLGIYKLVEGEWIYAGGIIEEKNQLLRTHIHSGGVYAVLYQDMNAASLRDYWMRRTITQVNADKPIRVFLDGEEVIFHEQPQLKDNSTTVEFRPIFEKLGLQVNWDEASQSVTGSKEGTSISLTLGKLQATVNEETSELPTAPYLQKGYTFVPLRLVGEASGRKVVWDANLKAVYLYDPATEGKLYDKAGNLLYEGQLKDGHMQGKGKLFHEDGTIWYDAEFVNDNVVGWGTIYFNGEVFGRDRTGDVLIGQFKNGIPDGYVTSINDNGKLIYEGYEVQGRFNGRGKYYEDGKLDFEGEFKDGQPVHSNE